MKIYDKENKFRWESYYSSEKLSYGNFEHKTVQKKCHVFQNKFSVGHTGVLIWDRHF